MGAGVSCPAQAQAVPGGRGAPGVSRALPAVSPYLKSLSMVAANKLLHLLEAFSTTWFLFSAAQNHHLVFFLLEVFNNIIQYQFDGEPRPQTPGLAWQGMGRRWGAVGEDTFLSKGSQSSARLPVCPVGIHGAPAVYQALGRVRGTRRRTHRLLPAPGRSQLGGRRGGRLSTDGRTDRSSSSGRRGVRTGTALMGSRLPGHLAVATSPP